MLKREKGTNIKDIRVGTRRREREGENLECPEGSRLRQNRRRPGIRD